MIDGRFFIVIGVAGCMLAGCKPVDPKYAVRHCDKATGSLLCNPEPDAPETGNGVSQPGILQNNQGPPGGGK